MQTAPAFELEVGIAPLGHPVTAVAYGADEFGAAPEHTDLYRVMAVGGAGHGVEPATVPQGVGDELGDDQLDVGGPLGHLPSAEDSAAESTGAGRRSRVCR
ncbi:hypothetical protein LP52_03525 [Streptomonospora alba]|uniref:Uncharacterized protein n=1 Tax=Streptomonospora alba TaxID=183763 RepID=A0A0C2JT79_9ACTN|nr:hypothetical protein [Streptomonospora alba]KII00028.1 hypothetical protein LP52_03525 [Streptomonospora alba]